MIALKFSLPTSNYSETDTIVAYASGDFSKLKATVKSAGKTIRRTRVDKNKIEIAPGLRPGTYLLIATGFSSKSSQEVRVSSRLTIHPKDFDLSQLRSQDHHAGLLAYEHNGTSMLVNPFLPPPTLNLQRKNKWFPTAQFEGATMLVNEDAGYYEDPLHYLETCLKVLLDRGASFLTWEDLISGGHQSPFSCLLQVDVDGGQKSLNSVMALFSRLGVRGSIMLHNTGHVYYPQRHGGSNSDWLDVAARDGWEFGYHNNSLSQVVGTGDTVSEVALKQAEVIFERDVEELRKSFDIRVFTDHGGNVPNRRVAFSQSLGLTPVDRHRNPGIWASITSMFSDGGFLARPGPMEDTFKSLKSGTHFMRMHPIKYGNFEGQQDLPPRGLQDGLGDRTTTIDGKSSSDLLARESAWFSQRLAMNSLPEKSPVQLTDEISSRFSSSPDLERYIANVRQRRGKAFLDDYPNPLGDPRIFWIRFVEAWLPKNGDVLTAGVLPFDDELEFRQIRKDCQFTGVDIDASRSPEITADIDQLPNFMNPRYDSALLFGLPYFESPSKAVAALGYLLKPGGLGIFGFPGDSHVSRGATWNDQRVTWSIDSEPLANPHVSRKLWSFSLPQIQRLFEGWVNIKVESRGDYWFVAGTKV